MSAVRLADRRLWVGDTAVPLLSGEMHYWRLSPGAWRAALQRIREMGLEVVATYIPWEFHELAPGHYDFSGQTDPQRNLVAFLDLLTAEGFWIILRPGPYIYSEWRNNGVPDHAVPYHRLHPHFQEQAETYLAAVTAVIRPYLAGNGGRVILVQADNEIDPWPHWYTEQLGLGRARGPFHDFLQQRYGDVSALNEAWGSAYQAFDEARAVRLLQPEQPDRLRRYLDTARFTHWYVNQVAQWAVDAYQAHGIDVPLIVNTYSGTGTQNWAQLEQVAAIAGPDIYPSQEFEQRAQEHRSFLEAVRYTQGMSRLPYIAEFEAGIWHDWLADVQFLGPAHYRLMCLSALLAGAVGWNWYMLVNRDNWTQSPINEWGNTRPDLFAAFRQITEMFREIDPPALAKLAQTAVTHSPLQRATTRPGQALLRALYEADIDYLFFDVENGRCAQPLLFYAGGPWLDEEAQRRLLAYIAQGGHLVCLGDYPRLDGALQPCNLLDIPAPDGIVSSAPFTMTVALDGAPALGLAASSWLFNYDQTPGTPITAVRRPGPDAGAEELALLAGVPLGERYTAGYTMARGQGRLTVLGLEPSPALLLALHEAFAVPLYSRATTPAVSTALSRRGETLVLIAVNNGQEAKTAAIALHLPPGAYQARDLRSGATWAVDLTAGQPIYVDLPRKDGTIIQLQAAGPGG